MAKTTKRHFRAGHLAAAAVQTAKVRERMVQVRKAQGLSAAEVSKQLGLSRPFLTQLEGGTRRMDLVYFLGICRVLRVEAGELLG
jgi:transcriptional regulator with XRE-family HTH domain